jgi:hypothetical protein
VHIENSSQPEVGADWENWPADDDSTLKPPIPLSTTTPGTANLFLSSPFEHVFKSLAVEVRRRSAKKVDENRRLHQ